MVTSHYTLDKQNAAAREDLAERGRFPGSDPPAVGRLQARRHGGRHRHPVPAETRPRPSTPTTPTRELDTLGAWHRRRRRADQPLFPATTPRWCWATGAARTRSMAETAATASTATATWPSSSDAAIGVCPRARSPSRRRSGRSPPDRSFPRRPSHISPRAVSSSRRPESSARSKSGRGVPVVYGGTALKADGTMTGKRLAALIGLTRPGPPRPPVAERGLAGSQPRSDARRELNRAYDRFAASTARSTRRPSAKPPTARNPPHAEPGEIPRRPGCHARDVHSKTTTRSPAKRPRPRSC